VERPLIGHDSRVKAWHPGSEAGSKLVLNGNCSLSALRAPNVTICPLRVFSTV
jgi:hypothetical protein